MVGMVRIGVERRARRYTAGWGVERSRCHHLCKAKPIFPGLKIVVNTYGNSSYDKSGLLGRKESEANFGSGWRREAGRRTTEDRRRTTESRGRHTFHAIRTTRYARRDTHDAIRLARYERRATRSCAKQSQLACFGAGNEGVAAVSGRWLRSGGIGVRMGRKLAGWPDETTQMDERLIRSG
jgi:hypothetical protein